MDKYEALPSIGSKKPEFFYGFVVVAVTLVCPDKKLAGLEVKSVKKRFTEKSFAAGASRQHTSQCSGIRIERGEFIELGVEAMKGIAADLGL